MVGPCALEFTRLNTDSYWYQKWKWFLFSFFFSFVYFQGLILLLMNLFKDIGLCNFFENILIFEIQTLHIRISSSSSNTPSKNSLKKTLSTQIVSIIKLLCSWCDFHINFHRLKLKQKEEDQLQFKQGTNLENKRLFFLNKANAGNMLSLSIKTAIKFFYMVTKCCWLSLRIITWNFLF